MNIKLLRNLAKRIKLPDTKLGKVLQAVGILGGVSAVATTSIGLFELTGDTVTDLALIAGTVLIYIYGKAQVPPECIKELED